jgi:hypothetical protein
LPLLTRQKSISRPKIKRKRKKFQINLETQKKSIILKPIEDPKNRTYSTGNNHTNNNRHKSAISNPSFPLESHQVSKNSSKKGVVAPTAWLNDTGKYLKEILPPTTDPQNTTLKVAIFNNWGLDLTTCKGTILKKTIDK